MVDPRFHLLPLKCEALKNEALTLSLVSGIWAEINKLWVLFILLAAHSHFTSGLRELPLHADMLGYACNSVYENWVFVFFPALLHLKWIEQRKLALSDGFGCRRQGSLVSSGRFAMAASSPHPQPLHPPAAATFLSCSETFWGSRFPFMLPTFHSGCSLVGFILLFYSFSALTLEHHRLPHSQALQSQCSPSIPTFTLVHMGSSTRHISSGEHALILSTKKELSPDIFSIPLTSLYHFRGIGTFLHKCL